MENATKIMIIAVFSTLIVIVLITVGVRIFTSVKSTTDYTEQLGTLISSSTDDFIYVISGYEVIRNLDKTVDNPTNLYYKEYSTKVPLSPNNVYTISFNYEILENKKIWHWTAV